MLEQEKLLRLLVNKPRRQRSVVTLITSGRHVLLQSSQEAKGARRFCGATLDPLQSPAGPEQGRDQLAPALLRGDVIGLPRSRHFYPRDRRSITLQENEINRKIKIDPVGRFAAGYNPVLAPTYR